MSDWRQDLEDMGVPSGAIEQAADARLAALVQGAAALQAIGPNGQAWLQSHPTEQGVFGTLAAHDPAAAAAWLRGRAQTVGAVTGPASPAMPSGMAEQQHQHYAGSVPLDVGQMNRQQRERYVHERLKGVIEAHHPHLRGGPDPDRQVWPALGPRFGG